MSRRTALFVLAGAPAFLVSCAGSPEHDSSSDDGAQAVIVMDSSPDEEAATSYRSALGHRFAEGQVSSVRLIGDSITAGYGCEGYGETTDAVIYDGPYGHFFETAPTVSCWANDFRTYAREHGVTSFVNAGISGAKLRWLAEDPDAWIGEGADVMLVMLGTNDAVYSSLEDIAEFARTAFAAVSERCTDMVVLLPLPNNRLDAHNLVTMEEVDKTLAQVCDEAGYGYHSLIDALDMGNLDVSDDGLHPNSKGSHLLWERIRSGLGLG